MVPTRLVAVTIFDCKHAEMTTCVWSQQVLSLLMDASFSLIGSVGPSKLPANRHQGRLERPAQS